MPKKRKAKKIPSPEAAHGGGAFTPSYRSTKRGAAVGGGFDPSLAARQMGDYYDKPPPKRDPAVGRLNQWVKSALKKREKREILNIRNRDDNF